MYGRLNKAKQTALGVIAIVVIIGLILWLIDMFLDGQSERYMELISTDMKWYILQAYSGYENKVKQSLEDMIKERVEDSFGEILVPTEEVLEIKEGQKKDLKESIFQDT